MTIQHNFSYSNALSASAKINWQVVDLIGGDKKLDFTKPFLPDGLAGVSSITSLNDKEKLLLNQIRGATYLHLFQLVEDFILPFALDHAREGAYGDKERVRALVNFAEEEAKHQQLFRAFWDEFKKDFPVTPEVIGPSEAIADTVLGHGKLGVALLVLHLEWLTQKHYLESIQTDESIDPLFADLLKHHWQEEAQHAKLDTLIAAELASHSSQEEIEKAIDEFLAIGGILDGGLQQQVKFDLDTLEKVIHRTLSPAEREEIERIQLKSYRWTFLVSGLEQTNFVSAISDLSLAGLGRVQAVGKALLN
jgi:hypothetical protein